MTLRLLACAAVFVALSCAAAPAQECITFQDNYATYSDVSSDGTDIYTPVAIDGSGQMTVDYSLPGCASIPIYSITHTPSTYIQLGSVGGLSTGSSECPDCYLYSGSSQSIAATPGVDYPYEWNSEVNCSFAGPIAGGGGSFKVGIAVSTLGYQSMQNSYCHYALNCPNGNQSATCQSGPAEVPPPCPYEYLVAAFVYEKTSNSLSCYGTGPGKLTNTPVDCQ